MSTVEKFNGAIVRTSAGLRDALFDELDGLRSGASNPARANAVAKLAGQVIDSVKMELDVQKHLQKMPPTDKALKLPPSVSLSAG